MFRFYAADFQLRADLLMSGRYATLAGHYMVPVAVGLQGCTVCIRDAEALALHLRRHHLALPQFAQGTTHRRKLA